MTEFTNVTIIKKANVYFEWQSRQPYAVFADGSKKTLGIMQPGEYELGTGDKELMEMISGELDVALPGAAGARPVKAGESFEVPANAKFRMVVKTLAEYCPLSSQPR